MNYLISNLSFEEIGLGLVCFLAIFIIFTGTVGIYAARKGNKILGVTILTVLILSIIFLTMLFLNGGVAIEGDDTGKFNTNFLLNLVFICWLIASIISMYSLAKYRKILYLILYVICILLTLVSLWLLVGAGLVELYNKGI
jgi:CDP-diglyceride synthetase